MKHFIKAVVAFLNVINPLTFKAAYLAAKKAYNLSKYGK